MISAPTSTESKLEWYAIQTLSNQELKAKRHLDSFIEIEQMGDFIGEILVPMEVVVEVKSGKKIKKKRKLYPGYIFVNMRLYDESGQIVQKPWYFVRSTEGIIDFVGGERPSPLKQDEINRIIDQVKATESGAEKPKVEYEIGQNVKINDGPFANLIGQVEHIDPDSGKLKVSVSIFGRLTPIELESWQVERSDEA